MPAPMPSPDDRAARTWAAHYATPSGFRYWPAEELVRFVGRRHGAVGRVLEVGCGNGANLWFLAEHADATSGIDICPEALRAAEDLLQQRGVQADVRWGSALALPYPASSFDLVVDVMTGQHLSWHDHGALFGEYRRVLRPGGWVFLYHLVAGTTGSRPGQYDYPSGIDLFPAAGWICLPDRELLATVLSRQGFGHVEQRELQRTYPDGTCARYAVLEGVAE